MILGNDWTHYQMLTRLMPVMKVNGTLIRRRRAEAGHGVNRFAALVGLSGAAISRIERGQRNPRPETLKKIADKLGCKIADFAHDIAPNDDDAEAATSTPPVGRNQNHIHADRNAR